MFSKPGLIIQFGEDGGSVGEANKERAGNTLGWEEAQETRSFVNLCGPVCRNGNSDTEIHRRAIT